MSEGKAPQKSDSGAKKTEVKKTGTEAPAATAETSSDKSAGKSDAAPKSASQTSISHFSSVSTPAYRSGWNSIFGSGQTTKKTKPKTNGGHDFPNQIAIEDEDIDTDLRNTLYRLFQRQARKQGVSLSKIKKTAIIEYRLNCNIRKK